MRQLVDDILAERRGRRDRRRRLLAGSTAILAHALLGAAIALAPVFAARSQAHDRDYVKVMIVPAKALGDTTVTAQPAPPKPEPEPKPEPVVVLPKEKKPAPAVVKPEKPRTESKPAQRQPTAGDSSPDESASEASTETRRRGGPDGTSLGTSPFGSSEASLDDPDFRYGYYVQQMLAIIGGNWVRPRAGLDTEVVVHYEIARDGRLSGIEIVRESGNRAFDAAGLRAVTLSSPLPPLPQSYPNEALGVTLLIR